MKDLKIIIKSIEEVKEYENNAKQHPEWQIEQIANSIKEFGFNDPIAINEDGQIIEGHGRLLAARLLGLKDIPCVVLTGLTEVQERAYIIAHNKTTMNTEFNLENLEYELNALKVEDFNLSLTGFSEEELQDIFEEKIIFDIPKFEEDTDVENNKRAIENYLIFNGNRIPITDAEIEKLESKLEIYLKENGVAYGFVLNCLLGG